MPSSVQIYGITISNGASGQSVPNDGFVDFRRIENFGLDFETTPGSLTLDLCGSKRRANVRYKNVIMQMGLVQNFYVDPRTLASDGTDTTEGTALSFQIYAERGDDAWITRDELNPGMFLFSVDCIARCIARALVLDEFQQIDVYDPTSANAVYPTGGTESSVPRFGSHIYGAAAFEIGAYATDLPTAEGMIAVVKI